MNNWYVYMVQCVDNSLYTGVSKDVEARVSLHNKGRGAKYTRSRCPVKLVYIEGTETKGEALSREIEIKKLSAVEKRQLVVATASKN